MRVYRTPEGRDAVRRAVREIYAASPVPADSRMLDTGEFGLTHVLTAGSPMNPPLVLLHGTSINSASWFGYLPRWADCFRVHALDTPGQPGLSDENRPPLTGGALRRWLGLCLDQLGLGRIHLCGMSMGGWMALDYGIHHPEAVRSMALLTAGGLARFRRSFYLKILPMLLQGDSGIRKISRVIHGLLPVDPRVEAFAVLIARHYRPLLSGVPLFTDKELQRITFPLIYFGGGKDPLLNTAATARRLCRCVPSADIRILNDASHVIPDQVEPLTEFFLSASRNAAAEVN